MDTLICYTEPKPTKTIYFSVFIVVCPSSMHIFTSLPIEFMIS